MNSAFDIIPVKSFDHRHIYSIQFENSTISEYYKFLNEPVNQNHNDYLPLAAKIYDFLVRKGFQGRHFQILNYYPNNISHVNLGESSLRLFSCVYGENVLFLGDGLVVNPSNPNNKKLIAEKVERLDYADKRIFEAITNEELSYSSDNLLEGKLSFEGE